jgi:CheY-like chemotaxis protein/signal transduction histidine kinase
MIFLMSGAKMGTTGSNENFLIRHATPIAIITMTLIMMMALAMFYYQGESNQTARNWVTHTFEVRGHLRLLLGKIKDAEIGERGYLITGNDAYLEPYNDAIKSSSKPSNALEETHSISEEIGIIKTLTTDNPVQQRNIDELEGVVGKWLEYLATTIKAKATTAPLITKRESESNLGKALIDHIRILMRVMEAEETRLLATRLEIDNASLKNGQLLTYSSIIFFYFVITFSIWLYQRSRARANIQMLHYTQQLERSEEELKMQQEELKASNEELESSSEEIRTANEELEEKTKILEEQNAQIRQQSKDLALNKQLIEEKAHELELANKYKSEFLANMSHELRTPLNSLLILARSLAGNEGGNLTEEQVEEARVIYNGGLELLNLINDILDLSKVEAGKLNILVDDTSLENIVRKLHEQFDPVAKETGVSFQINIAADLPAMMRTDQQRVEQIIKNLLSNAFKFTTKGSVSLNVHRPDGEIELQRTSLEHENAIAFSVNDTGIGIETSKLKDIFEAFQQEDGSTDRHYGGTGLGLTIARKFAHMLGGEIHVVSAKGKGSTFTLILPIAMKQEVKGTSAQTASFEAAQESSRIQLKTMPRSLVAEFIADDRKNITNKDKILLIIEDDRDFAMTLIKIARKRGYKCLAAGNGKTGLLLAAEQPVTAIILDLMLPDIDGLKVLDQLKHDLRTRHIPVHIISAADEERNVVPLRKGAIGYLAKPVEQEAINGALTKIEELLQSEIKQILVIEDDKISQAAIHNLLKKKDVRITMAGTGSAALESIKKVHFDCVILDLRLPDMTGFVWLETAEKEAGESALPPVIVYTAKDLTEEENRQLNRYTGSIIIKGAQSPERLLDEVTLFLHSLESTLSKDQQDIIRMQHDPDKVLQGRTVLLTDDDLRNTFALSKLLKKHGMKIVIADNGQMAIEKLKEQKSIELVIMDIMMPVMDGYQAMREIRAQQQFQKLPIIALTARAMPEEQEKCIAAGANDYLTKPVDIERLLTLLRVWLFKQELAA